MGRAKDRLEEDRRFHRDGSVDGEDEAAFFHGLAIKARQRGLSAWLELLSDIARWRRAPNDLQDLAIRAAAELLKKDFAWESTEPWGAGSQRTRLASFRWTGKAAQRARSAGARAPTDWIFRLIPGACFQACPEARSWVSIRPCLVGLTAVTVGMAEDLELRNRAERRLQRPIEEVTWQDAQRALHALGAGFCLPSERHWSYACHAGQTENEQSGSEEDGSAELALAPRRERRRVARGEPNAFGLYDMPGQVWEWCEDEWHETGLAEAVNDEPRLKGAELGRVLRGGSRICRPQFRKPQTRSWMALDVPYTAVGFRIFRPLQPYKNRARGNPRGSHCFDWEKLMKPENLIGFIEELEGFESIRAEGFVEGFAESFLEAYRGGLRGDLGT